MIPNFKNSWTLCKTNKIKPMGYRGYIFTLYDKNDVTVLREVKAKTASQIWYKIVKLMEGK